MCRDARGQLRSEVARVRADRKHAVTQALSTRPQPVRVSTAPLRLLHAFGTMPLPQTLSPQSAALAPIYLRQQAEAAAMSSSAGILGGLSTGRTGTAASRAAGTYRAQPLYGMLLVFDEHDCVLAQLMASKRLP